MTELIIDGIQAVLPDDFSIAVKHENPFIEKNGEYTYDITLPMSNPVNASLYGHLNRLNAASGYQSNRRAVLICDNRVYCNGTEVVTGWTDDSVTIQIAAGNSELNYILGSDVEIATLGMRSTAAQPSDHSTIEKTYPDVDFCLAPVINRTAGITVNKWRTVMDGGLYGSLQTDGDTFICQPFLCAYLKELLKALGYQLIYNQLEDTEYKKLYIVHVNNTIKWCEMLPGWTAKDFLEQVEQLFNAVFVIDNKERTARLMLRATYYNGTSTNHVRQVADVYEASVEEADVEDPSTMNVSYKFPSSTYYRRSVLPDALRRDAKRDVIPADFSSALIYDRLQVWFNMAEHRNPDVIYTDERDGRQFIYVEELHENALYTMVDFFAELKRESATDDLELEIMPVELGEESVDTWNNGSVVSTQTATVPVIDGYVDDSEQTSLIEKIDAGSDGSNSSKDNIYLAFYEGLGNPTYQLHENYPFAYTDELIGGLYLGATYIYYPTNSTGASLRPSTMDNLFYESPYDIDYTREIVVESYDPNVFDTRRIFEIHNRRFICKDIEYTLSADGRKGAWKGTFYPIRISDTEADARWILTDGKWRDGGVWLDNGRWLDE